MAKIKIVTGRNTAHQDIIPTTGYWSQSFYIEEGTANVWCEMHLDFLKGPCMSLSKLLNKLKINKRNGPEGPSL